MDCPKQTKERGIWAKGASKLNADVWKSKAKVIENEFNFRCGMPTFGSGIVRSRKGEWK